jgi:hypothetical protein
MLRVIVAMVIAVGGGIIALTAPPIAAAEKCDPGYYWSKTHGDCVERPDNNSVNATALCNDGLYSHSQTPGADENCSGHGGVAQMCPCGATAAAAFTAIPTVTPFGLDAESAGPFPLRGDL